VKGNFIKRGALAPLSFSSPSPLKERGIKGVRLTINSGIINKTDRE
jgi:hypothetical protein